LVLAQPAVARADHYLERAVPTPNGISRSANVLTLRFSEPVDAQRSQLRLRRGGGGDIPVTVRPSADGRTVKVEPATPLRTGTYQVAWRFAGSDGHMRQGAYDLLILP
jgi:methionine-rich copper-binding protein CopC